MNKHFTMLKIMYGINNNIAVNVKIDHSLKDNKIKKHCSKILQ